MLSMNNNTNSRNTILQCALKLFGERGYESVGINEITQMAGITKPTLYYFFQSKEGVFKAILEEYYERFNNLLRTVCIYTPHTDNHEDDIFPVLLNIVQAHFYFAKENTTFYLMVLSLSFAPPTAQTTIITTPYILSQYDILIELFREMSNIHKNIKGKEKELSYYFNAMINANIAFWYKGLSELDDEKAKRIVHQFLHGIFA